jgi:hypothetical protein
MARQSKQPKSAKLKPAKKRMSSEAFLKKANKIYQAGPPVKYTSPDAWNRALR